MIVLIPEKVTSEKVLASNVPMTDRPEWAVGVSYSIGDQVMVLGSVNLIYESVTDANLGNDPTLESSSVQWLTIGAINRFRAFDDEVNTITDNSGKITYTLAPAKLVTAISFFELSAKTISVVVKDASLAVTYTNTINLIDTSEILTFLDYIDPIQFMTSAVIDDLVAIPGYTIEITIDAGVGTATVGFIQVGKRFYVGDSTIGSGFQLRDFSSITFDEFGSVSIVRRPATRDLTLVVAVKTKGLGPIQAILTDLRAQITTWWSHEDFNQTGTGIVGILSNFSPSFTGGDVSFFTVEIKGII